MTLTARLTLVMVLLTLSTAAAVGFLAHRNLEAVLLPAELERLNAHVKGQTSRIDELVSSARNDLKSFTAGAAGIEGIVRARLNKGIDPEEGVDEQVWRTRVARRFAAELQAKADYVQYSFIEAENGGREILRVDRSGPAGAVRVVPDAELVHRGGEEDFAATLQLPPGTVHLSPIHRQEENGRFLPVIRVATPIQTPAGKPFGLLLADIDLGPTFARVSRPEHPDGRIYVVDETGEYLLHPDPARTFGGQRSRPDLLQNDFPVLASALGSTGNRVQRTRGPDGEAVGLAMASVRPGGGRWLGVIEITPEARLLAALVPVRQASLLAGSLVAVLAVGLAMRLARSLTRPLVALTHSVESFAAGQAPPADVSATGEIGRLAGAFEHMREEVGIKAAALRESEELFSKAFRMSPDCVAIARLADRTVIRANEAMCRLWGSQPEDVIGKPTREFAAWLNEEERLAFRETLEAKGECLNCETTFRLADGRIVDFSVSARIIRLETEACVLTVMRDITAPKQAEAVAARLAAIVQFSDDAIIGKDLNGNVTSWNAGAEKIFGYAAAEMIGQSIRRLIPADRQEEETKILSHVRVGKNVQHLETIRQRKDGSLIDVSITTSPIKDAAGRIIGFSKVAHDITERKQAEARIHRLNAQLEQRVAERTAQLETANVGLKRSRTIFINLFESLPGLYLVLTPAFRIVTASDAYTKATYTRRQEIAGRDLFEILPDNPGDPNATGAANLRASLERVLRSGAADSMAIQKYDIRRPDGGFEERYWSPINSPVLGVDAEIEYLIHRVEDVTEFVRQKSGAAPDEGPGRQREHMEIEVFLSAQKLQAAKRELEAANRELEAFSYSVSHDLRAPLRAVSGFSQAVIEDFGPSLPPEGRRQLEIIQSSAHRMGELIDDLLTFSRLSRQALRKQPVDMTALVRQVFGELTRDQGNRRIELAVAELPPCDADPALLRQVLVNLLSNALKFTGRREQTVVEVGCRQQNGDCVYFVRDNGTGFDMEYAQKLFDVFARLHRAEDFPGTGVGLAIVQRIVQRHGGRVWAEAASDRGATFYFTLPTAAKK